MILLFGEKVMVDEIDREMLLGWESVGEWVILYILFFIQLFYSLLIIFKIKRLTLDEARVMTLARGGAR